MSGGRAASVHTALYPGQRHDRETRIVGCGGVAARLCPPASTLGSTAAPITTRAPRVGWLTTRRFSGCGARRACACRCRGAAKRAGSSTPPSGADRGRRQMWCGRSISKMTPPLTAVRSRSYPPSMSTPANASAVSWSDPITAERLANELDDIVADRGVAPRVLRLDNGPEMIAAALAEWRHAYGDAVYSAGRAVGQSFHRIVQWSATR